MFSKSTEYALRAVLYIAKYSSADKKIGIETVSTAVGSPKSFTAKVLQKLTKNNCLINSVSGPNGGFFLTEEAKKTSMLRILEILEEEHVITKCVLGLQECSDVNPCPMHNRYKLIKPLLIDMFENKSIQDVLNELTDSSITLIDVQDIRITHK
ncbi:MAG: Rrf2 family transcriptional regulator [Saprospiraceae bacterium]|nr:Rrf2 family transcriptional regulator [Saprospiraceae bacterium]